MKSTKNYIIPAKLSQYKKKLHKTLFEWSVENEQGSSYYKLVKKMYWITYLFGHGMK